MPCPSRAGVVLALASLAGCGDAAPMPALKSVSPALGYTDRDLRVVLRGSDFVPSYRIDTTNGHRIGRDGDFSGKVGNGTSSVDLVEFGWRSSGELSATISKGLPAGTYSITLTDPR